MNNFEKLKNMSIKEMTEFIAEIVASADCKDCPAHNNCKAGDGCKTNIAGWLMEEAI